MTVGLVGCGYHPWSALWKRNQSLFAALASRAGVSRGLFINPAATWRSLWRGGNAQSEVQRRALRAAAWPRRVTPKVRAWTPLPLLPLGRLRAVRRLNRAAVAFARRRLGGPRPWIVIVNDPFLDEATLAELRHEATRLVFDLSDDFVAYDHRDEADREDTAARVERLVRLADLVLAVNERLTARYRALNPHTYTVPNGCHYELFAAGVAEGASAAAGMSGLRAGYRGLAGYFGWMVAHRIDVELLDALARARPDWCLVLVGPAAADVRAPLARHANVRFVDTVPHRELPAIVAEWDACLLPHRVNENTAGNDPLKLYEYLAAGKPVVATAIAGVERFPALVSVASTAAAFAQALDALPERDGARVAARQAAARAHSWTARADAVERLLRETGVSLS
jgi:glycosyltransferase involved in cell wall biosynthesis